MKNDAGQINKKWYDNALSNGTSLDIEEWFSIATNRACLIDKDLCVWCWFIWLTQEQIDLICETIDSQ